MRNRKERNLPGVGLSPMWLSCWGKTSQMLNQLWLCFPLVQLGCHQAPQQTHAFSLDSSMAQAWRAVLDGEMYSWYSVFWTWLRNALTEPVPGPQHHSAPLAGTWVFKMFLFYWQAREKGNVPWQLAYSWQLKHQKFQLLHLLLCCGGGLSNYNSQAKPGPRPTS